jgi:very-short-patch-repair endonuclease
VLPFKPLRRAVREAMALKRVTVREVVAVPGRTGGAKLTKILADGCVPTRSELEDAVHDVIRRGHFEEPQVNRDMIVGGRWTRPDFLWPEQRLVVEADGREWHDHRLAREDDAERQARLEAAGYRVLRVTWQQAIAQPAQTIARLRAALSA